MLDRCLAALEESHTRDEQLVSPEMVARLAVYVPGLRADMSIADAIEAVFVEQEKCLGRSAMENEANGHDGTRELGLVLSNGAHVTVQATLHDGAPTIDEAGARALTDMIRSATHQVCILLLEAHDRRAWSVLGYQTWAEYVREEFGLSRSRSYELLDQGRVIHELQVATGRALLPDVSAYAALQIKPHLPQVVQAIRERTSGLPDEDAKHVIADVVRMERVRIMRRRKPASTPAGSAGGGPASTGGVLEQGSTGGQLSVLHEILRRLAAMPPVAEVITWLPDDAAHKLPELAEALDWLKEFASAL